MQTVARLIQTFTPDHYNLSLHLDREARTFQGTVDIRGAIQSGATSIKLHAKDLTIQSALIDGKEATFSFNDDELTLAQDNLNEGEHLATIAFSGIITDSMHGLYPCYYEHNGEKKELLATQFESHHAREVFPCVDEPEAKATFDLTLVTEDGITVLGNMPVASQTTEEGRLVTTFETSPRMSSYLLAWVTGELHKKTATTKGGVEVNVWATPAQPAESLDFALDIATRSIDFFDDYYGTPYPLPKSDHVALPDFSSGAMENWGLVTYREIVLVVDPVKASLSTRQQAALTIAHELSHQWFGNLVTMKWWNDLWLNESFANMMEYVAIDALEPDWNVWLDQASYEVVQALRRDSIEGVQAIQSDVSHPDEINTLFDPSIVYAKGGRLLRMLQTYIGDEALQEGLRIYFKKYAYQNTEANNLWQALSEASGQDISLLMNAWISQSGYPVVHVERDEQGLHLTQEQFFVGEHLPSDKLWPIPLGALDTNVPRLLVEKSITIPTPSSLVLNHESTAHFVTHYSPELLAELIPTIPTLSHIDRLKLLNEQVLLAQGGVVSSAELIPLLAHYRDDEIEAVWDIVALALGDLKRMVDSDEPAEAKLRSYISGIARDQYQRLGWTKLENETESDTKLRSAIISFMIYGREPEVLEAAYQQYHNGLDTIDPNLFVSVVSAAVKDEITPTIIDDLFAERAASSSSDYQERLGAAITATKNPEVIQRLLGTLKDSSVIRPQDMLHWLVWLLRSKFAREDAWKWLQDNWTWLEETFNGDKSYDILPRYVASALLTEKHLQEYIDFFTPLKEQLVLQRNIEMGVIELRGRVAHIQRDGEAVKNALLNLN